MLQKRGDKAIASLWAHLRLKENYRGQENCFNPYRRCRLYPQLFVPCSSSHISHDQQSEPKPTGRERSQSAAKARATRRKLVSGGSHSLRPLKMGSASGTLFEERVPVKLSLLEVALWVANSILSLVLVFVLFFKRRWRVVPWFTAWMSYSLLYALSCFLDYRLGSGQSYKLVYWIGALGDFLLQIAVVGEIARSALTHQGRWVEGVRAAVLPVAVTGSVIAALLTLLVTPAASNLLDGLAARASLFSTILVCFLFVAIVRATQNLGLDWRGFVARESFGLTIWTLGAFITDSLHAYWRTIQYFGALENIKIGLYQAVLLFWCVAFWVPEPDAPTMPADIKKEYLARIQE